MASTLNLTKAESLNTIQIPGNPSGPTRHRWAFTGVKNAAGERVKLQTWKAGGRRVTTPEAVDRFFFELNSDDDDRADTPEQSARRSSEAARVLESFGC